VPVDVGDTGEGAALAHGQVFWVLPQGEPGALELAGQRRLPAASCGVPGLAADLVQRVGGPADDVEGVQAQHCLGAARRDGVGDPVGGVRADQAELARAVLAERVEEAVQRGLVMAGRGPDQPAGVVVDHHRQVAVPLAVGDLVDADAAQPLQAVDVRPGLLCDAREHPADGAPGHPQQFGDRHPGSVDRQPRRGVLERAGEAGAVACPGHGRHDHAVAAATHPRRLGLQERLHYPEVQRAPASAPLAVVVARAASTADTAPAALTAGRPHQGDDGRCFLVERHMLDHGVLDAEQPRPYPLEPHAVPPPWNPAFRQPGT
jgi:hypothetical protein